LGFPLGLGRQRSSAQTPPLGRLLVGAAGSHREVAVILLVAGVVAIAVWLLIRPGTRSASWVAGSTAAVLLASLVLAPAARFGEAVYPIDLAIWAWCLRAAGDRPGPTLPARSP